MRMCLRREGKGRGELGEDGVLLLGNMMIQFRVVNVFSFMIFRCNSFSSVVLDIHFLINLTLVYLTYIYLPEYVLNIFLNSLYMHFINV